MQSLSYLRITIGGQQTEVTDPEDLPFSIDYKLEDEEDFQVKRGSEATEITIPATTRNSVLANSFEQVGIEDATDGKVYRSFQPVVVVHNGHELMVGKAILVKAREDDKPLDYTFNFYADNSDWTIGLKESTFWDFLKHIRLTFTKQQIIDSWQFNGRDELLPYVFAPVRYGLPMDQLNQNGEEVNDINMIPQYMKPSLSKYWIIYWAFKSLGYKIQSEFFDTDFFRRQVMPWTWGTFLYSDGTRLSNLYFLAKSNAEMSINSNYNDYWDLGVVNDSSEGAFNNNKSYSYNVSAKAMTWTYLPQFNFGELEATFSIKLFVEAIAEDDGDVVLRILWYKNNQLIINGGEKTLVELHAPTVTLFSLGRRSDLGFKQHFMTTRVNPNDKITAKIHLVTNDGGAVGKGDIRAKVEEFRLDFLRVPLGGIVHFENYDGFKKYKFLDFLRGVIDEFNLSIKTDNVNKLVLIEPTHNYTLPGETAAHSGFFNGDFIDWNHKQDVSKISERMLYSDFEREVIFKYKNDTADGLQKKVQDRNSVTLGAAKYVLPDRFKVGKKEIENRFFSSTVHYIVDRWQNITGVAPQMIAMVPENISNTAKDEAQNTFLPKSCYYKGVVQGLGWLFDGVAQHAFPLMFSVNYMPGGENDPVLSYSDERIGIVNSGKLARGLLKRFFVQRLAIMRNGEWYNTWFKLNDNDIVGKTHREFKICRNQRWELINITNFAPLKDQSTAVLMRRWVPAESVDMDNTYPSDASVLKNRSLKNFDLRYDQMKCVALDIPQ